MIAEMFPGVFIQEKAISFVPGERVDDQFPVDDFITGLQPGIDSGTAFTTNFVVFPFLGFTYGTVGQITVSAHDRAPEVTSQVDLGGEFFGRRKVSAQSMDIEIAIVVEIDELPTPGPSGFGDEERGWL